MKTHRKRVNKLLIIESKNVSIKYPKTKELAVSDFSVGIEYGDIFALLGPNGSGKTTFIEAILGYLRVEKGWINVMQESPDSISIRERIGYLPENLAFFEDMTAYRHLYFFSQLDNRNNEIKEKRIKKTLQDFDLENDADKPLSDYSKGMRRRFGLCQAFLDKPELVILDEPTAGLDVEGIITLRNVIKRQNNKDTTFIISSHNLSEVEKLCNRIAFVKNAKLITLMEVQHGNGETDLEDLYRKWVADK